MSATLATMLEIGTKAPKFTLPDTNGNPISIDDLKVENGLLYYDREKEWDLRI